MSNIRAAYAQAQTAELTQSSDTVNKVTYNKPTGTNTTNTVTVENVSAMGRQEGLNDAENLPWAGGDATKIDDSITKKMGGTAGTYTLTFTYDSTGKLTSVTAA